jgi:hypothetical protein
MNIEVALSALLLAPFGELWIPSWNKAESVRGIRCVSELAAC